MLSFVVVNIKIYIEKFFGWSIQKLHLFFRPSSVCLFLSFYWCKTEKKKLYQTHFNFVVVVRPTKSVYWICYFQMPMSLWLWTRVHCQCIKFNSDYIIFIIYIHIYVYISLSFDFIFFFCIRVAMPNCEYSYSYTILCERRK